MTAENIDVDFIKRLIQDEISKIQSINQACTISKNKNNTHLAIGIAFLGVMCAGSIALISNNSKPIIKDVVSNAPAQNNNYSEYINKNDNKPFSRNFHAPPVNNVKNAKIYLTDRNKLQQKVKKAQHEDEISKI